MRYKVGDKVRVVKERTEHMNGDGLMDKYLNTNMTIIGTKYNTLLGDCYVMQEDRGNWWWTDTMIENKSNIIF